jgi:hypothetical protein
MRRHAKNVSFMAVLENPNALGQGSFAHQRPLGILRSTDFIPKETEKLV